MSNNSELPSVLRLFQIAAMHALITQGVKKPEVLADQSYRIASACMRDMEEGEDKAPHEEQTCPFCGCKGGLHNNDCTRDLPWNQMEPFPIKPGVIFPPWDGVDQACGTHVIPMTDFQRGRQEGVKDTYAVIYNYVKKMS